jgi:signal peptidase I
MGDYYLAEASTNRPRKIKSIIKPIAIIAIVIGGIFGTYFSIAAYLGSETPVVIVTSESMHPVYYEGDILFVKYVPASEIEIGMDIVFYADWIPPSNPDSDIPVVHRVIDKELIGGEWYFTTQGVNEETNPFPDPAPTPYSNVLGIVVFNIPRLGLPLLFLRSTIGIWGIQIFVIVIAVILVSYVVYDYYSESKTKDKEVNNKKDEQDESLWTYEEIEETKRVQDEKSENAKD